MPPALERSGRIGTDADSVRIVASRCQLLPAAPAGASTGSMSARGPSPVGHGRQLPCTRQPEPRRLGDLSNRPRRFSQRESGLRARIWSTRWLSIRRAPAGRDRKSRAHFRDHAAKIEFTDLLKASASQVTAFAQPRAAGSTPRPAIWERFFCWARRLKVGTYESDVFDAHIFPAGGARNFAAAGNVEIFARSGNVDNPDRNWSPWKKVDCRRMPQSPCRLPASSSGKQCCTPAIRRHESTA